MQMFSNSVDRDTWRARAPEKFLEMAQLGKLRALLDLCPAYIPTPLQQSLDLARALNIAQLSLKDETARMGLGAFKALGGAHAIFDLLLNRAEQERGAPVAINHDVITTLKPFAEKLVFCCASAGNHGLSVAAGAKIFSARAIVYLANSVPEDFAERLRAKGAEVRRAGADYDESMCAARTACEENGWMLISDTSWEGYEKTPLAVMKGYSMMTEEIAAACARSGRWPSHVFLQGGVGGLAGALTNHIRVTWQVQPTIVIVEPDKAACLMASVRTGLMTPVEAHGTNMGRLDCAEASMLAFEILRGTADFFATVSDEQANAATETLTRAGLATTPSGAAGYAGLAAIASNTKLRHQFGIDENAHCLCFVTECALPR